VGKRAKRKVGYVVDRTWLRTFRAAGPVPRLVKHVGPKPKRDPMADHVEGSSWWLCRSDLSRKGIQDLIDRGEVAGCLYERMGAIIELGKEGAFYRLAVQLVRLGGDEDWDIDLCLSEIGIRVDELYEEKYDAY
jgi:hypothetical protein